ncbi:hypothetical protein LUZ60_012018 [Juncus effusus]|nr:hypothetical protein LUZ60_012018 [Juncus effusus]
MLASSSPTNLIKPRLISFPSHRICNSIQKLKQSLAFLITSGLPFSFEASTPLWNNLLRNIYTKSPHYCNATLHLFKFMLQTGGVPNEHTYPLIIKSCSNRNPDLIHSRIIKSGLDLDSFVKNSLVSVYAKSGDLSSACELFDQSSNRDFVTWTSLIHGYVENKKPLDALTLFKKMKSIDVEIDGLVLVSVLKACGLANNIWVGMSIHGFYIECKGIKSDVYLLTALVDVYMKCGQLHDARKVFDEMPFRNVVTWSSLIDGYQRNGLYKDSLSLLRNMLKEGIRPNQVTLTCVLTACSHLGALDEGKWIHNYMKMNKIEFNPMISTALIDMYGKCGCIENALEVFNSLPKKGVYTWSATINNLALNGQGFKCLSLFDQMVKENIKPNEVTLLGILCACSHCGLVDQGRYYFTNMIKYYGIKPKLEHYCCMIDLLGRAGFLNEALCMIKNMPFEPNSYIWGSLLSSCMLHKNYVLGEKIGKYLVEKHPSYSGGYMILANMNYINGKLVESSKLRRVMKERKMEKVKGCSWIEINGASHEFISFDLSSLKSKEIYETLDGVLKIMKMEGFEPDICL